MNKKLFGVACAVTLSTALLLSFAAVAQANVTPTVVATYPTTTEASRHSDWRQVINLTQSPASDDLRKLVIDAPTGLMGNPTAVPAAGRCTVDYRAAPPSPSYAACPASSDVGDVSVAASIAVPLLGDTAITLTGNIFELLNRPDAAPEVPTHLGIHLEAVVLGLPLPVTQDLTARITPRKSDAGLHIVVLDDMARADPISGSSITINQIDQTVKGIAPGGAPFLTNPTRCDAWTTTVSTRAYDSNTNADADLDSAIPGNDHKTAAATTTPTCDDLPPFEPTLTVDRSTTAAGAPTGVITTVEMPASEPGGARESHVKQSIFSFPLGFEVNPAVANAVGDVGCTDTEFNKADPDVAPTCPAGTHVGNVTVATPLLSQPLSGAVYLGKPGPTRDDRYRLLIYFAGGINAKMEWRSVVADNGQVSVVLGDPAVDKYLPQFPFTAFTLSMNPGPRALVTNPQVCGDYAAAVEVTPWSGQPTVTRTASLPVTAGTNGSCDFDAFSPTLDANLADPTAGVHSDLTLTVARGDRQDNLRDLRVSLPRGLAGSLQAVNICPAATAAVGACDESSRVGSVDVQVGSGSETTQLHGTVHVIDADPGDVGKLSIQVASKVGPFDLGATVSQSRVIVRSDLGIDSLTAALPQSVQGIPVRYRNITVTLNGITSSGKAFMSNPTACGPLAFSATVTSAGQAPATGPASATLTDGDQSVTSCADLPFAPSFSAVTDSGTRNTQPSFDFVVGLPDGNSNVREMRVALPDVVTINLNGLNHVCDPSLEAAGACPEGSVVGNATLNTPLLAVPLTGVARVVRDDAHQLPDLVLTLGAPGINVRFAGTTDLIGGRVVSTFANLPDLPFSDLRLHMNGGPTGVLKLNKCPRANGPIDVTVTGQGGQTVALQASLNVDPCATRLRAAIRSTGARKPGNKRVRFSFKFELTSAAAALKDFTLTLPHGGRVNAKKLRTYGTGGVDGRRLSAKHFSVLGKRTVRITQIRSGDGSYNVSLKTKNSALTLPYKLVCGQYNARAKGAVHRKLVRCKRRKLTFVVRTTDVGGSTHSYRVKVRAGSLK